MEVQNMNIRKELDGKAIGLMTFFCAVLGMQQIVIKAATPDMAPVLQIAIRSGIAALIVGVYLRRKGMSILPGNGKWLPGLTAGLLFTLEYFFVAEGLLYTNASHMVTMLYTAPAFAALGLHFLIPEERLRPMQWCGMVLAFCGVVIAFYDENASFATLSGSMLLGDFLGLLAGMAWGATTVVIRTKLSNTPATQTAFIQLITCFCILLPGAALTDRFNFSLTNIVWGSLLFQIVMVCVVAMLLWFWMLTVYPASQLGALSFLTPVFGIVFGVALLGEPVEPKFVLGSVLVLAGITLVSGWQWFARQALQKRRFAEAKPRRVA
jgi:drug/metabolite transporter (DMT)-like permease